jgi:hypothetical protein
MRRTLITALLLGACSTPGAGTDAGMRADVPFVRPDVDAFYEPQSGTCGFGTPAFCDTFESGPSAVTRSGELDATHWSVLRGMPYSSASFDDAFRIGPALIGACRSDLEHTRVLPDSDVLVCGPVAGIPSRHALATAAAQNYGLSTYRIRQPFDFAGRTGAIHIDLSLENNGLGGWPAIVLSEDPAPAPSFDWQERGSGPRNGVEIEFSGGWCNTPHTVETSVYTFADYAQTASIASFDCETPHATTAPDALSHVEIFVTQSHLEVWASDVSSDGVTFAPTRMLWSGDVDLPFTRGYVTLALRNHATLKYWLGSAAELRFDNVGFDGPVIDGWREYSAPDSLTTYSGAPGCTMGGTECLWEGDVIPAHPTDDDRVMCAETVCDYETEGRNVGYVLPNEGDTDTPPASFAFTGVSIGSATRARLVLAATYPAFDWNEVSMPPTAIALRYRVNGGEWHERFISAEEATAFTDFSPELGGAGAGAGLLNQVIDLDLSELHDGDDVIEMTCAHTWTGTYRAMVTGVDLVLDQAP